ncbi:MAG: magnesium transporter [Chloroflexi bacterium]|nr:magnesium transporter [Chloroflexota bacterium]MYE39745.1 magnesium transporter [Chloroflexota bacterium]
MSEVMYEEQLNDPGAVQVEQRTAPPYESAIERASLVEEMIYEGMRDGVWSYYMSLHPSDRAAVLTELPAGIRRSLAQEMQPETLAGLLDYMEPRISARVLRQFSADALADVLDLTDPATSTEILGRLPGGKRLDTIAAMEASRPVEALLRYEEDSIGRLADVRTPVLSEDTTVPIALDRLRLMGTAAEEMRSLLVVNNYGFLVGSLNPVRLALARPSATVGQIMDRDITSVTTSMDEQVAVQIMSQLRVSELPVVEEDGRLVGLVRAEDAVEVVEDIATEDMYRMAGIGEERITGPLAESVRSRFPWLALNLVTVFLAAAVIGLFESTIARVVALAAFLPVVAGQGGIGGTQTVTLVVRSLATGGLPRGLGLRILRREMILGLIHGLVLGAIIGGIGWVWEGNAILGGVLALAMTGNMVVASVAGAGVPLLLRRLRMDPAVSAAVFVTTFTDVIGFALFLGLATIFIEFLL